MMRKLAYVAMLSVTVGRAAAQDCGAGFWRRLPATNGPDLIVFDEARGRTLGFDGAVELPSATYIGTDQTYLWDGLGWARVSAPGPVFGSFGYSRFAYDSWRQVVVGVGRGSSGAMETWLWDGAKWTLAATGGSEPRSGFQIAFDRDRGRLVMHGGAQWSSGTSLTDTWEWDGAAWVQAATGGPASDKGSMAYDEAAKVTLLVNAGAQTWTWDGSQWRLLDSAGAGGDRTGAVMVYDSGLHRAILLGGYGQYSYVDSKQFRDGKWTALEVDIGPWLGLGAAYDRSRQTLITTGGYKYDSSEYDYDSRGGTWEKVGLGGFSQIDVPAYPPGSYISGSMTLDPERDVRVYFGGQTRVYYGHGLYWDDYWHDETWEWAGGPSWSRVSASGPSARVNSLMIYDEAHREVLLHGGYGSDGTLGDTWSYSAGAWTRRTSSGPVCESDRAAIAYDTARSRVVMHGMQDYDAATWEWIDGEWRLLSTDGPATAALAYDPPSGLVIAYYTDYYRYHTDTYGWNGAEWTLLSDYGPNGSPVSMFHDLDTGKTYMVMYNDSDYRVFRWDGENWLKDSKYPVVTDSTYDANQRVHFSKWSEEGVIRLPRIYREPTAPSVSVGDDIAIRVGASGGGLWYRWSKNGIPLVDAGRVAGSENDRLIVRKAEAGDAGDYAVQIVNDCGEVTSRTVHVTVTGACKPDCTQDGRLTVNDFLCFQVEWRKKTAYGDYNGDGKWNVNDFIAFQASFRVGCG